jgi:inorganic pyrophosphatase
MDNKVSVYIEIEKGDCIKYEFDKTTKKLEVDRILPDPYVYPYSYGFIENTLAMDGDDLDALIVTETPLKNDARYDVYIIGVLVMEDEKGMDEKVLCVLEGDYERIQNIHDLSNEIKNNIHWFFSKYKSETPSKWSRVHNYEDKDHAVRLFQESKRRFFSADQRTM